MCGNILCVAVAMLGIDAGWQPLPEGGVRYLIQIEPHVIDTLREGDAIESYLPPQVKGVQAYRITVGTAELPRQLPPEPVLPSTFQPEASVRPIAEQQAALVEPAETHAESEPSPKAAWDPPSDGSQHNESDRPWMTLTLTLLLLFASLGGNAYLLWIAIDSRRRYQTAMQQTAG